MNLLTRDYQGCIYVCEFSTGLIKVGRGKSPVERISAHQKRLGCAGITLEGSFHADCNGNYAEAEAELISRCVKAATKQYANEWFEGLSFGQVCEWAKEIAATPREKMPTKAAHCCSNPDSFFLDEWMHKKASRFAALYAATYLMGDDNADIVFDVMPYKDQFILNDCIAFGNDLANTGVSPEEMAAAIQAHALDVIFVQENFWERGRPPEFLNEAKVKRAMDWRMARIAIPESAKEAA